MSHRYGYLVAVGLILGLLGGSTPLIAAPVPNPTAKYEQPTAVGQLSSVNHLITEITAVMEMLTDAERVERFKSGLKVFLPGGAPNGIDVARPVGSYLYLRPKIDESVLVMVFPITSEKDAIAFAKRCKIDVNELDAKNGIYEIREQALGVWRAKFMDNHLYAAIRFDGKYDDGVGLGEVLDKDRLIPMSRLVDSTEKAPLHCTLFVDRIPVDSRKFVLAVITEMQEKAEQISIDPGTPSTFKALGVESLKALRSGLSVVFEQGRKTTLRVSMPPDHSTVNVEFGITPSEKSSLETQFAAIKPAQSRFAGLANASTVVAGNITQHELLPKPMRQALGPAAADAFRMLRDEVPAGFHPVLDAAAAQLDTTISAGKLDLGYAIVGPNKDDQYTAIAGLGLEDTAALVKAALVVGGGKDLPKGFRDRVKLNAAKAGDIAVHSIRLGDLLPKEMQKVFGEKAEVMAAFGGKTIVAAVGPDALAEITRTLALKPGEGQAYSQLSKPEKTWQLMMKLDGNEMPVPEKVRKASESLARFYLEVRGGKELTIRIGFPFALAYMPR